MQISQTRKSNKGFTLIELAAVIFILALVMGISFPVLGNFAKDPLKESARKLSGVIRNLYYDAVMKKTTFRLNFDLDDNKIWITEEKDYFLYGEKEEAETKAKEHGFNLPKGIEFEDITTEIHGKNSSDIVYLTFFSEGWIDYGEIRLKSDERVITLLPNSSTGKVTVKAGYVEREDRLLEK